MSGRTLTVEEVLDQTGWTELLVSHWLERNEVPWQKERAKLEDKCSKLEKERSKFEAKIQELEAQLARQGDGSGSPPPQ